MFLVIYKTSRHHTCQLAIHTTVTSFNNHHMKLIQKKFLNYSTMLYPMYQSNILVIQSDTFINYALYQPYFGRCKLIQFF